MTCVFQQHPNATNSSETSVGGVSGACGSSGIPAGGEAGCSSRGGSSSGAGGTAGQGCEQGAHGGSSSHSRESHAKFRHGLLQLMIHTIDPLHDGQSRAGIPTPHSITLACRFALALTARSQLVVVIFYRSFPSFLSFSLPLYSLSLSFQTPYALESILAKYYLSL